MEAKTAVMLEPYTQPEGHEATPLLPNPGMFDAVAAAHERNVDLHLHAIGDGAVRAALDAIERAKTRHPESDTRTTICHIEIVSVAADVERFAQLGAVAQTTPTAGFTTINWRCVIWGKGVLIKCIRWHPFFGTVAKSRSAVITP